ncbi:hypothetical protein PFISCL1PPCAC_13879, partial [Pristionchus fissidentatus]
SETTTNPYSVITNFTVDISPLAESIHTWLLQICGITSILLSSLMIVLIAYRTPMSSKRYRMGLIALHVCYIVFDLHACCLFAPVMPLPFFAGYCLGVLCTVAGLRFHGQFVVIFIVTLETFACFFICMLQRNQKLQPAHSRCRLSPTAYRLAINMAIICSAVGPMAFVFAKLSDEDTALRIEANPEMAWIADKPGYVIYSINLRPYLQYVLGSVMLDIVVLSLLCVLLVAHTSYVVHSTTTRSTLSKMRAGKAMNNLFMQVL